MCGAMARTCLKFWSGSGLVNDSLQPERALRTAGMTSSLIIRVDLRTLIPACFR